ncbi:MAG: hypothetical protein RMM53_05185, partial [Bacteroidia bacterium]|nr:hypothetical protein [Bacteroidia bacterium]
MPKRTIMHKFTKGCGLRRGRSRACFSKAATVVWSSAALWFFFLSALPVFAQFTYNDGPIAIDVRIKRFWSKVTEVEMAAGLESPTETGITNEYVWKIRLRERDDIDGLGWSPVVQDGVAMRSHRWSPDNNNIVYTFVSPPGTTQAPTAIDFDLEAWEDNFDLCGDVNSICAGLPLPPSILTCTLDCGSPTTFESGMTVTVNTFLGNFTFNFNDPIPIFDIVRRFKTGRFPIRGGAENEWQIAQVETNDMKYAVQFEYRWRYLYAMPALCPGQEYHDGPMQFTLGVDQIWSDSDFCQWILSDEPLVLTVSAKENLMPAMPAPTCLPFSQDAPAWTVLNSTLINQNYAVAAPSSFQYSFDAWRNNCGDPCVFDPGTCGGSCSNRDERRGTLAFGSQFFRHSPPNTENYVDVPISAYSDNNGRFSNYTVRLKYRWTMGPPQVTSIAVQPPVVCEDDPVTIVAETRNATYLQWQVGNAYTCDAVTQWTDIPGAVCKTLEVPTGFSGPQVFRLKVMNRAGPGSTSDYGPHFREAYSQCVVVTRNPVVPPIIGPCEVSVAANSTVAYSLPPLPGVPPGGYTWTVTGEGNTIVSGQNTSSIIVRFGTNSGTVGVTVNFGPCGTRTKICNVEVDPQPTCEYVYVSPDGSNTS